MLPDKFLLNLVLCTYNPNIFQLTIITNSSNPF